MSHIVPLLSAELAVPAAPSNRDGVLRREDRGAALILEILDSSPENPLWLALTSYDETGAGSAVSSPGHAASHVAMRSLLGRRVRFVLTAEFLDEPASETELASGPQGGEPHLDADATGIPHPLA